MTRYQRYTHSLFALAMMSLGVLALIYVRLGMVWYSVPDWVPWGGVVTLVSGLTLLAGGAGLCFERTASVSARFLWIYLVLWLLLRVPSLVHEPQTAVLWENAAEIGSLVVGAWLVLARLGQADSPWDLIVGATGRRRAQVLFGLSLVAFGVSHFAYIPQTAALVPAWLPFRNGWAYLTGLAHAAAGLGILFSVVPGLAATLEAIMLSLFTVVVWVPAIIATPSSIPIWTEIVVSLGVTAAAWVVADSLSGAEPLPR